jgi:hypothetical protein
VPPGDLDCVDAGNVVSEDAFPQPFRQLRRIRLAPWHLVVIEDSVEPDAADVVGLPDRFDSDPGSVVGDHRCLVDGDEPARHGEPPYAASAVASGGPLVPSIGRISAPTDHGGNGWSSRC